jgi:hypothetical protein
MWATPVASGAPGTSAPRWTAPTEAITSTPANYPHRTARVSASSRPKSPRSAVMSVSPSGGCLGEYQRVAVTWRSCASMVIRSPSHERTLTGFERIRIPAAARQMGG